VSSGLKNSENFDPIFGKDVDWMSDAACLGMDVDLFFPEDGKAMGEVAKKTCNSCSVKTDCYIFAEQHFIDHGIFGGMSPYQRQTQRRVSGRSSKKFKEIVSW